MNRDFLIKSFGFGLYMLEPVQTESIKTDVSWMLDKLNFDVISVGRCDDYPSRLYVVTREGLPPSQFEIEFFQEEISNLESIAKNDIIFSKRLELFRNK